MKNLIRCCSRRSTTNRQLLHIYNAKSYFTPSIILKNDVCLQNHRRFLSSSSAQVFDEKSIINDAVIKINDGETSTLRDVVDQIVEAAATIDDESSILSQMNNWTPAGLVRLGLTFLQQTTGMPWWEVIMIGVVAGRLTLMPFTIASVKFADRMRQHREPMSKLSEQMLAARRSGDALQAQVSTTAYFNYMTIHGISPLIPLLKMIPMSIYFMSFYFALKSMAAANLPSMKTGGVLWFSDLTVPDPIFLLPVLCAGLLSATFKVGAEVEFVAPSTPGLSPEAYNKLMNIVLPLCVLAFTPWFSSALLVYWCTSNFVSLILASIFRTDTVRKMLKLQSLKKVG